MKCALLLSGTLKTYHLHLKEFVQNVVKPNHADVFIELKPDSAVTDRATGDTYHADHDQNLKSAFGKHLKVLKWLDQHPESKKYIDDGRHLLDKVWVKQHGLENMKKLEHFDGNYFKSVDQYLRLRSVSRLFVNYCQENNVTYDKVCRLRIDVLTTEPIRWSEFNIKPGRVFAAPSVPVTIRDQMFVSDQTTMLKICEEFPEFYLRMTFLNKNKKSTKNLLPKDKHVLLSPECQLAQYLARQPYYFEVYTMPYNFTHERVERLNAHTFVMLNDHNKPQPMKIETDFANFSQNNKNGMNKEDKTSNRENADSLARIILIVVICIVGLAVIVGSLLFARGYWKSKNSRNDEW